MANAVELVAGVRGSLSALETEIREHPYLSAAERKQVSVDALRAFPGHQYHIGTSDLRSLGLLVERFGHTPARDFFIGVLQGEQAALSGLLVMGQRLGMSEADLRDFEVTPNGFAYATFMSWMALYASAAEFTCGILVNFAAWGANCGRLSQALRDSYGFVAAETAFLDAFAEMPSFEDTALAIIQDGLDSGVSPRSILRAARLFQAYEKMFWDAMGESAGVL